MPRYVEMKNLLGLEVDDAFQTMQKVWLSPVSLVHAKRHTSFTMCPENPSWHDGDDFVVKLRHRE